MRQRHGWTDGSEIEAVDVPAGVMLRVVPDKEAGLTIEEAFARIWSRSPYRGPPIRLEDMDAAVSDAAAEQDRRSR